MNALWHLRIASMMEGISYLFLLFVAMPIKYLAGDPRWVTWSGRVHGGLFVLLVLVLIRCGMQRSWAFPRALRVMGFALVPFGAFVLDREFARELRDEEAIAPESA